MTDKKMLDQKSVLITGGTGSFGQAFIAEILKHFSPSRIVVFSRDELKQSEMQKDPRFVEHQHQMRYFIGDIRDKDRLSAALAGVDVLVHAAALKQVPALEYNPFEAVKTNVIGSQNVIDAAIANNVDRIIALSTDKAAAPINLYGATKLAADKLFVAANNIVGSHRSRFAVVRYGNVFGSRGSVVPFFLSMRDEGVIPITDERMTRFNITLEEGVSFVIDCLSRMRGGELFVPKIPSYRITDLAEAIAPAAEIKFTGIRPGEKIHEEMITETDSLSAVECDEFFILTPSVAGDSLSAQDYIDLEDGDRRYKRCAEGFRYWSGGNDYFLSVAQLRELVQDFVVAQK